MKIDLQGKYKEHSQITVEKLIQDKLNLYQYIVFLVDYNHLLNSSPSIKVISPEEINEENKSKIRYAVIMPDLGKPLITDMVEKWSSKKIEQVFNLSFQYLQNLHSKGIIHNDVKPLNILYQKGNINFIDYGLSKIDNINCISKGGGSLRSVSPYLNLYLTPLKTKYLSKEKCRITKFDDYLSLYYTFLDISGISLPWLNYNNIIKELILFDQQLLKDNNQKDIFQKKKEETEKLRLQENLSNYQIVWLDLMIDPIFSLEKENKEILIKDMKLIAYVCFILYSSFSREIY